MALDSSCKCEENRTSLGLPYLKRQNSWQSQWLLCVRTNKRYRHFQYVLATRPTNPSNTGSLYVKLLWTWKRPKK